MTKAIKSRTKTRVATKGKRVFLGLFFQTMLY